MIRYLIAFAGGAFVGSIGAAVTIRWGVDKLRQGGLRSVDELLEQFGDEVRPGLASPPLEMSEADRRLAVLFGRRPRPTRPDPVSPS